MIWHMPDFFIDKIRVFGQANEKGGITFEK